MIEHINRHESQPGPMVRSRLPAAVSAVLFGGYDFSGMAAVAATPKLDQLAELSARADRNLCLWLVHRRNHGGRVELLCTESMGMNTIASVDRLMPTDTTLTLPSSYTLHPLPDLLIHELAGMLPLLYFKCETLMDACRFEHPANDALLRTIEVKNDCWDDCVDVTESPVIGLLDYYGYDTLHWKVRYPHE